MKKLLLILAFIMGTSYYAGAETMEKLADIEIIVGDKKAEGIIYNTNAGKDFLKLLPQNFNMEDFNSTEKISYLKNKLDISNMPSSFDPSTGDIAYYGPWGNFCIFYKDFRLSQSLYPIGKVTKGIELLSEKTSDFQITIKTK